MPSLPHHYFNWLPYSWTHHGWLGVNLFFILSGFLITSILLNLKGRSDFFPVFYKRRALRIFPLYYLVLAVYFVAAVYSHRLGSPQLWASYVFYYSSLVFNQEAHLNNTFILPVQLGLTVLWSLSIEEIYYTIWAPVVRWSSHRVFTCILIATVLLAPVLRWILHTPDFPELFLFYCRMDGLALGSLVAIAVIARKTSRRVQSMDKACDWAAVLLAVTAFTFWASLRGDRSNALVTSVGISLMDFAFALIVYATIRKANGQSWWLRSLRAGWLRSLGGISYALYLIHYPILYLVSAWIVRWGPHRHTGLTQVAIAIVLSVGASYVIRWTLESPIERWKTRHIPSDPIVSPAMTPVAT